MRLGPGLTAAALARTMSRMSRTASFGLAVALGAAALAACSASADGSHFNGGGTGGSDSPFDGGGGGTNFDAGLTDATPVQTIVAIGPGADADSPTKFGGAPDLLAAPEIVYPADGVLVPKNMNSIEVHFRPAQGQSLFEITFDAGSVRLVVYTGCTQIGAGCVYTPDQQFWDELATQAGGKPPVTYVIRGVDGASPGAVGTSAQQKISFTSETLTGGLYYWNTSALGVIQRFDFANPTAKAEDYLNAATAGQFICVGCHTLSRDGKLIAAGGGEPTPAVYKVYDVATRAQVQPTDGGAGLGGLANFTSFSPDGRYLLEGTGLGQIFQRDLVNDVYVPGNVTPGSAGAVPVAQGTEPDWSPDGRQMVYVKGQATMTGVTSGQLETLDWDGSAWSTTPNVLVPFSGANAYYPAFSPDSQWILYNNSPGNHDSYSNAGGTQGGGAGDGEMWIVSKDGGTPVELALANKGGKASWAKWVPAAMNYAGGDVLWLTFTSYRAYGLRLAEGSQAQLWMMAIDLGKLRTSGEKNPHDPSMPPFWLPFQDMQSGNHIAQWVAKVERQPCSIDPNCPSGQVCRSGLCLPDVR